MLATMTMTVLESISQLLNQLNSDTGNTPTKYIRLLVLPFGRLSPLGPTQNKDIYQLRICTNNRLLCPFACLSPIHSNTLCTL